MGRMLLKIAKMSDADFFKTIGVSPDASFKEMKSAYRKWQLKNHSDMGGNSNLNADVNSAFSRIRLGQDRVKQPLRKPEAPKPQAPKPEAPKPEAPKPEAPKPQVPKPEAPKPEAPKPEAPKPEAPKPPSSTAGASSGSGSATRNKPPSVLMPPAGQPKRPTFGQKIRLGAKRHKGKLLLGGALAAGGLAYNAYRNRQQNNQAQNNNVRSLNR